MNASISVACYKSKILSTGEHPIMLRVAKDEEEIPYFGNLYTFGSLGFYKE